MRVTTLNSSKKEHWHFITLKESNQP